MQLGAKLPHRVVSFRDQLVKLIARRKASLFNAPVKPCKIVCTGEERFGNDSGLTFGDIVACHGPPPQADNKKPAPTEAEAGPGPNPNPRGLDKG
jgi:hypothetical protein